MTDFQDSKENKSNNLAAILEGGENRLNQPSALVAQVANYVPQAARETQITQQESKQNIQNPPTQQRPQTGMFL